MNRLRAGGHARRHLGRQRETERPDLHFATGALASQQAACAEESGHEFSLRALIELGRRPDECTFLESWITNSNKVFAVFRP